MCEERPEWHQEQAVKGWQHEPGTEDNTREASGEQRAHSALEKPEKFSRTGSWVVGEGEEWVSGAERDQIMKKLVSYFK